MADLLEESIAVLEQEQAKPAEVSRQEQLQADVDNLTDNEEVDFGLELDENGEEIPDPGSPEKQSDNEDDLTAGDEEESATDETGDETNQEEKPGKDDDTSVLPDDLIERGKKLGFPESVLRKFDDVEESEMLILRHENPSVAETPDDKPGEKQQADEATPFELKPFDFKEHLEEGDEVDPIFLKMDAHYHQQLQEINKQVSSVMSQITGLDELKDFKAASDRREGNLFFDNAVNELGTDYEAVFGKGETESLDVNSKVYANRADVVEEINIRSKILRVQGKPVSSLKKLFTASVHAIHPDVAVKKKEETIKKSVEKRKKQSVSRSQDTQDTTAQDKIDETFSSAVKDFAGS